MKFCKYKLDDLKTKKNKKLVLLVFLQKLLENIFFQQSFLLMLLEIESHA